MARIVRYEIVLNLDRPLGPQIAAARATGCPWKILEDLTGLSRQRLATLVDRELSKLTSCQIRNRQRESIDLSLARHLVGDS